jgi:tight adherence protein B
MGSVDTVLLVGLFVAALAVGQAAVWAGGARREAAKRVAPFHWDGRPPSASNPKLAAVLDRFPGMRGLQQLQAQAGSERTGVSLVVVSLLLAIATEVVVIAGGGDPVVGLAAAIPASAVPIFGLYISRSRRSGAVLAELPAAMRSLYRLSGAGHGAAAIVAEAAKSVDGPLGIELRRAFEEQRRGRPLEEALRAMAERVPGCVELQLLVTTIVLAEESGADLGVAVAKLESTVSRRIALRLDLRAETARARLSAGVISGMPFVGLLGVWFLEPEWVLAGWADPAGRLLQQCAVVLIAIGLTLIVRLLRGPR